MKTFIKGSLSAAMIFIKALNALADELPDDKASAPPPAAKPPKGTAKTTSAPKVDEVPAKVEDSLDDNLLNDSLPDDFLASTPKDKDDFAEAPSNGPKNRYTREEVMQKLLDLKLKLGSKDVPMKLIAAAIGNDKTPCLIADVPLNKLDALYAATEKRLKAAG